MAEHVIIDGNNLLHAMHAHAPIPLVGRETMVRIVERWARRGDDDVTLVFDGPEPRGGLSRQMASKRIHVRFSAPKSADDIVVELMARPRDPTSVRVVSSDTALARAARARRCRHTEVIMFVRELFAEPNRKQTEAPAGPREKPPGISPEETEEWLKTFGFDLDEDEPFDGADAMKE